MFDGAAFYHSFSCELCSVPFFYGKPLVVCALRVKHRCCSSFLSGKSCREYFAVFVFVCCFSLSVLPTFFDVKSLFVFRAVERLFYLFFAPEGALFCEKRGKNADFAKKKWKMFCS